MSKTSISTKNRLIKNTLSGMALMLFACLSLAGCGGSGSSSGSNVPPVSITPPNTPPVIQSSTAFTVDENQTSAFTASATDAESAALTYSLSGDDAALLNIDASSGVATFASAPNFENPADQGRNNIYSITLSVSDGTNTTAQDVMITVNDIQEAPIFSSDIAVSVEENQTSVFTALAIDPEGATLTYSLSGPDADLLEIDSSTGVVSFSQAPDFETPEDQGGDNIYDVNISAEDGELTTRQEISITVTDFPEARIIDLGALSSLESLEIEDPIVEIDARFSSNQVGQSISATGDINGDGFNDLIVGAPAEDVLEEVPLETAPDILVERVTVANRGTVYVIFGTNLEFESDVESRDEIAPEELTESQGFIIRGESESDFLGYSVSFTGDVNGDGFDDIVIGAPGSFDSYVIFGTDQGFGSVVDGRRIIDLSSLSAAQGFIIRGDETFGGTGSGISVSDAGDMNNDGFDDVIIRQQMSSTYVIFGTNQGFGNNIEGRQIIDTATLSVDQGFIIQETGFVRLVSLFNSAIQSVKTVSSAGDINGDGFADILIENSREGSSRQTGISEAYVIFGSGFGFGSDIGGRQIIDINNMVSNEGFIILGEVQTNDLNNLSVSSAGDINADGFSDIIIGAPYTRSRDGQAYVIFGGNQEFGTTVEGRQIIDILSLSPTQGFIVLGDGSGAPLCEGDTNTCNSTQNVFGDLAGQFVSFAGDINGDGFDDFMIGAPAGDDGAPNAGEVYFLFGKDGSFGSVDGDGRSIFDLTNIGLTEGVIIQGDRSIQGIGRSFTLGDFDGDEINDFIIGEGIAFMGPDVAGGVNIVSGTAIQ